MNKQRWMMLLHNQVVAVVIALMLLVPALFAAPGAARVQQLTGYGLLGLVLFVVWLTRTQDQLSWQRVRGFLFRGPNLAIIAYLAVNLVSVATSKERFYGQVAYVQFAFGAVIYATVAYQFRHRSQVKALLSSLVIVGVLVVLAALAMDPQHSFTHLAGSFHDPQLFGAFLMLQLPMVIAIAVGSRNQLWRIAAQLSAVLIAAALLMTGCRSSWLGALVAVLVFGALGATYAWTSASLSRKKHELIVTPILAVVVLGIFIYFMGLGQALTDRVVASVPPSIGGSAGGPSSPGAISESAADRASRSKIALSVWKESPVWGVGLGTYALHQVAYNPDSRPKSIIISMGASLSENPHNLYLQILAEQGVIGLALYLAIIALFFGQGLRSLPRINKGLRQYTLIGAMAAVAGMCVDGIANPGWSYPEVSTFMWLIMGIGMCAAGIGSEVPEESRQSSRSAAVLGMPRFLFRGVRTALIGCAALWLGAQVFGIQSLAASAGEQAGFGRGTRAGSTGPTYCEFPIDNLGLVYLQNHPPGFMPSFLGGSSFFGFDSIGPPEGQKTGGTVGTGLYPRGGAPAAFKIYALSNERQAPQGGGFGDVTPEFPHALKLVGHVHLGGGSFAFQNAVFNPSEGAIDVRYAPNNRRRVAGTYRLTFRYECAKDRQFFVSFDLTIPPSGLGTGPV